MALADVGDLVGHDRSEFGLGLGIEKESGIYPDDSTGRGECIQFLAVDDDEGKTMVPEFGARREPVRDVLEITVEQRIWNGRRAAPDLGQKLLPHAIFFLQRNGSGYPVAERRQARLSGSVRQDK